MGVKYLKVDIIVALQGVKIASTKNLCGLIVCRIVERYSRHLSIHHECPPIEMAADASGKVHSVFITIRT